MTREGLFNNKKIFDNRLIFYVGIALLFFLVFIRNVFSVNFPVVILLIVYSAIVLFCGKDEIVALAISCIPLSAVFQYKYALLISILLYSIKYFREIKVKRVFIPLFLMLAWEFFHGIKYDWSVNEFFRGFAELIFCCFVISSSDRKINYQFICRFFAVTLVFVCTILFISLLEQNDYDIMGAFTGSYRFGVRDESVENFGANYNPNGIGLMCNLAIATLSQIFFYEQRKIIDVILICFLLFFGVLTMSRSFLLCLAVLMVLFLFTGRMSINAKVKRAGILLFGLAFIVVIIYLIVPEIFEKFMARFSEEDISNGRINIFKFYNEHLLSNNGHLWFGMGLQGLVDKIQPLYPDVTIAVPHNAIQELIVLWGIPGLLIFTWFIVELIIEGKKGAKKGLINYLLLLLVLIEVQFGQLITSGAALLALSLVYLSIKVDFNGEKNERVEKNS